MGYLIPSDYNSAIQDVSLQQIISGNSVLVMKAELFAQGLITSHLTQKYDVGKEFTNTQVYNPQATYNAADRVYLDAPAYNTGSTYTIGQLTLQAGKVYQCTTAITAPELFTPAHWTLLGNQYDLFYANYPFPVFDLTKGAYRKGDKVFWNNHIYKALRDTRYYGHDTLIQYGNTNNVPYQNTFPDDPNQGYQYWYDEGLYVVPAGNLLTTTPSQTVTLFQAREDLPLISGVTPGFTPGAKSYVAPPSGQPGSLVGWKYGIERRGYGTMTEGVDYEVGENGFTLLQEGDQFGEVEVFILHFLPITDQPVPVSTTGLSASQVIMTYFTQGDNRNQQMVQYMMDIVIYRLYTRIAPKNIPEQRADNYHLVISWLKDAAKGGDITADLTEKQPPQGGRIRWGSNIKQQNSY